MLIPNRKTCSYQKGTSNSNSNSNSIHMGAICTAQTNEQRITVAAAAFKMETTERDNYLNLYFVGGYECAAATTTTTVSAAIFSHTCACCIVVVVIAVAAASAATLLICSAVALCSLSHYLQLRSARSVCSCACVGVNAILAEQREKSTQNKTVSTIFCVALHLCGGDNGTERIIWIPTQIFFSTKISSDWSIQAWDLTMIQ